MTNVKTEAQKNEEAIVLAFNEVAKSPSKIPRNIISSSIPGSEIWKANVSMFKSDLPNRNQTIVDIRTIADAPIKAGFKFSLFCFRVKKSFSRKYFLNRK